MRNLTANNSKRIILMKFITLLISLVLALQGMLMGQGYTCQESEPFCTGSIYTFPAGTTGYAQQGAFYGCLATQPAPAWYHMLIDDPGTISIYMYSTPLEDIDFICWGPFTDPYDPCVTGLTQQKVVDCSYSPLEYETCDIPNGQTGEYYILLITNYSQNPCNITFSQTGGNGSTDCTILPPPVGNNGPLCVGETLELTAAYVVNATYYWSGPAGFLSTQQNPVIPNVTLANGGNYSCVITVNGQSSDPSITNVSVFSLPSANLLSEDTTICPGTAAHAIFQFTGWGPYSVTYNNGLSTFTATGLSGPMDTIFLTPSVGPATYTFTQVEDLHCSSNLIFSNMVVGLFPAASAQLSGNASICSGESAQLTFNLAGTPPWTIVYTANGANAETVTANSSPYYLTVYPAASTLYEIQSINDIHCDGQASGSAQITVQPTPVASAGNDLTIPYGTNTSLNGSASGGSGNYQYHWEPAAKLVNPDVQQPQTVNLSETTVFTLTATDNGSSCEDTDEVTITIEGGPLGCFPSANPDVICRGESSQLNSMASGGSGTYTYLWTSNPGGFSSDISNPSVSPDVTTTYTVVVDDGFNVVTENVTVTVRQLPVAEAGQDKTIAHGTNTTLAGSATGGSGTHLFHWEPADKLENPNTSSPTTVNLYSTTLFTLYVTDMATGCEAESPDQISVIVSGDALAVNPTIQPEDICLGESAKLFALAGGGSGTYNYSWYSSSGFSSTEPNPTVIPTAPGSYIYFCTVDDGYNDTVGSVALNVRPQPHVDLGDPDTTVCVYDTITLDAGNPGASYLWSNGSTERFIKAGSTGLGYDSKTFSVVVTNESGCEAEDHITVVFDFAACAGIDDPEDETFAVLYPNPGQDRVYLHMSRRFEQAEIQVIDLAGRVLIRMEHTSSGLQEETIELNLEGLAEGLYYVRFQSEQLRPFTSKYLKAR